MYLFYVRNGRGASRGVHEVRVNNNVARLVHQETTTIIVIKIEINNNREPEWSRVTSQCYIKHGHATLRFAHYNSQYNIVFGSLSWSN